MLMKPPADELAEIRAEIRRLKRREAELREAWLTEAELPKIGHWHKVDVVTHRQKIFDPRLLPDDIRTNPAFLREKVTRTLRLRRKTAADALARALAEPAMEGTAMGMAPPVMTHQPRPAAPAARMTPRARLFASLRAG